MQDLAGGDNNRTPVIFQGFDIYIFVGDIQEFETARQKKRSFHSSTQMVSCFAATFFPVLNSACCSGGKAVIPLNMASILPGL